MTDEETMPEWAVREGKEFDLLLEAKDELTPIILRFHLATENMLERIIAANLPKGNSFLGKARLTYAQKLELVNAFDFLQSDIIGALRALNTVRNQASHRKNAIFSINEIDLIGRPLGKIYTGYRSKLTDEKALLKATIEVIFGMLLWTVGRCEGLDE